MGCNQPVRQATKRLVGGANVDGSEGRKVYLSLCFLVELAELGKVVEELLKGGLI
jgi:hypothetical protein